MDLYYIGSYIGLYRPIWAYMWAYMSPNIPPFLYIYAVYECALDK